MPEHLPAQPGIAQADPLAEQLDLNQFNPQEQFGPPLDQLLSSSALPLAEASSPGVFDRLRNKWTALAAAGVAVVAYAVSPLAQEQPAYAANTKQAYIGMPFTGKWAFTNEVAPPYTDSNSSHPSVHAAYSFQWATDLYEAADTEVKVHGSSPQGTVTFKRVGTSDTCSTYGPNIAGSGVTFDVLVEGSKVGEVKYDHLDLTDVGNEPIASGTKIGEITTESLHSSCYQVSHAHIQFKNTESNQSCYIDRGATGQTLAAGTHIGILGSDNTVAKTACPPEGGSPTAPDTDGDTIPDTQDSCPSVAGTAAYNGCPPPIAKTTTVGVYDPSGAIFHLRDSNTPGPAGVSVQFGNANWEPLSGDWNGDGTFSPGAYDPATGMFYLRNSHSAGAADVAFQYGNIGWKPIVGDWDGNGYTSVGLYDPATSIFYLKNFNGPGAADHTIQYGNANWMPLAGDWDGELDGNHQTTIGVYDPFTATYHLNNQLDSSAAESSFQYGNVGWTPISGDWDGNRFHSIGQYDSATSTFYLRNLNNSGPADVTVQYGNGGLGWKAVVGDWNGGN